MSNLKQLIKDTKELTNIKNERHQRAGAMACISAFMDTPDDVSLKLIKKNMAESICKTINDYPVNDEIEQHTKQNAVKNLPMQDRIISKFKSWFK